MRSSQLSKQVEAVRRFNRFYTHQIGVLNKSMLNSPYSLTEARVLYELSQTDATTASELGYTLGLDAGYLSRMLQNFRKKGLIRKQRSKTDGRQSILSLTEKGRDTFVELNGKSCDEVGKMLEKIADPDRKELIQAMNRIQTLLGTPQTGQKAYLLRHYQPGDIGWVVQRHAELYATEFNWGGEFEAMVAEIAASFINNYDPKKEQCWIAEMDGERVGSVFLVKVKEEIAKLRMLIVEPKARGLGIGARLVEECIRFARKSGYKKMTLWTNSNLHTARRIYQKAGFQLVQKNASQQFGKEWIEETWEMEL